MIINWHDFLKMVEHVGPNKYAEPQKYEEFERRSWIVWSSNQYADIPLDVLEAVLQRISREFICQ